MKILAGGCRVYSADDGRSAVHGTWSARTLMERTTGARLITQAINEYRPGAAPPVRNSKAEEVLYVVSGHGTCRLGGYDYPLASGTALFIPPRTWYAIDNPGPEPLRTVSACCPEDPSREIGGAEITSERGSPPVRTVRESEREEIRAGKDRVFRYLAYTDIGCRTVTQFVGWIPESKAPFHHHTYEEGIYILDGQGLLHIQGESSPTPFGAGMSIYFPAGVVHCLENPGPQPIRVLGVFHPSGSPGVAYEE